MCVIKVLPTSVCVCVSSRYCLLVCVCVIKVLPTSVCVCVCVEPLSSIHTGRCYPCIATVRVSCVCGGSHITVPCGQERNTQAPSCERPCTLPSCCLHPHTCHPPPCAPCTKPCGSTLNCGHTCKALCHSTPKPKVLRSRPWQIMLALFIIGRSLCGIIGGIVGLKL